jgi:hypothetical protein
MRKWAVNIKGIMLLASSETCGQNKILDYQLTFINFKIRNSYSLFLFTNAALDRSDFLLPTGLARIFLLPINIVLVGSLSVSVPTSALNPKRIFMCAHRL